MSLKLDDYFKNTFEEKLSVKLPALEDDHLTPTTRLMERKRELADVEQALTAQKEEFNMKMKSMQERRNQLESKEGQLKDYLLKFDTFLKENEMKRTRAYKKIEEERESRKKKEKTVERLQAQIVTLIDERERYKKQLERNHKYRKYMEAVQEATDEFPEIRAIVTRYDTLVATHKDLLEQNRSSQTAIEIQKQKLVKYAERKNNAILSCDNKLAALQARRDEAEGEVAQWENKWTHIQNTAATKTLMLGRIKIATHNIYQNIVKNTRKRAMDPLDSTLRQLDKINRFLKDLIHVTSDMRRNENLATHSSPSI